MAVAVILGPLDDVLVAAGCGVLIARQFMWRTADPVRLLRLPLILLVCGVGELTLHLGRGVQVRPIDAALLAGEVALVALTGSVMGRMTQFRRASAGLQYRLTR